MASLMASETLILRNPNPNPKFLAKKQFLSLSSAHVSFSLLCHRKPLSFSPIRSKPYHLKICASSSSSTIPTKSPTSTNPLTGSTRTITTLCTLGIALSKVFSQAIQRALLNVKGIILAPPFQRHVFSTVGPLFLASLRDRPSGYLNTPLTVVASGMSKWLDIYSGVLMVRVLLSWFPNIPWDRQPLSAIRDLCDPYLNLFRNIIPPIFDTLDVSPLLAFAIMKLNNSMSSLDGKVLPEVFLGSWPRGNIGCLVPLIAAMCVFLFFLLVIRLKGVMSAWGVVEVQANHLIFRGSTSGLAFVEGLFEYRAKTLSHGDQTSRIWESPLIIYSFVLVRCAAGAQRRRRHPELQLQERVDSLMDEGQPLEIVFSRGGGGHHCLAGMIMFV
ncbi:CCB3/YggT [Dillenia turbinata]|uniref:CCB3/YggT n=1 Tax=Dillenia turbinata TaxID=194707 RepID=A0AAN8ZGQ7_9MAGN